LGALNTRYIPIGQSSENVGIVDLVVRRDYAERHPDCRILFTHSPELVLSREG
jgi:hypothetical protein